MLLVPWILAIAGAFVLYGIIRSAVSSGVRKGLKDYEALKGYEAWKRGQG